MDGDRPNDFKFQFGGVVIRGSALQSPLYAGYGSLFVVTSEGDHANDRTMPPFQGNGDGPSGGPLMTMKGKPVDLFFHPTGVRGGTILERNDIASFSGHIAPLLSAKVAITITAPNGRERTIRGQASAIGYFYDPASDFRVDESGVWKARVKVTFDGVLPSTHGQVHPPYPTGDVLGSREGEFFFYVVQASAAPLVVAQMPRFVRPADGPITFTVTPPVALSNVQVTTTTVMPGFILEETTGPALTYTYDAPKLARDFPNLDLHDDDGLAGVDPVTISFLVSGTDSDGVRHHFARQVALQGEELLMTDQKETVTPPRRRPVR